MLIRRGIAPCRDADPGRALAIGNFDGLHLGHQAILAELRERGRESRLPTAVVCFEPHLFPSYRRGTGLEAAMRTRKNLRDDVGFREPRSSFRRQPHAGCCGANQGTVHFNRMRIGRAWNRKDS